MAALRPKPTHAVALCLGESTMTRPTRRRSPRHRVLFVEQLEYRSTPSTYLVTSPLDDGGSGTLRSAIQSANNNPGDDVINFAPGLFGGRGVDGLPIITL